MARAKRPNPSPNNPSRVSPEDATLFVSTVADAKPLRQKKRKTTSPVLSRVSAKPAVMPVGKLQSVSVTKPPAKTRSNPAELHDMDHRTAEKFRRGQMVIEARVDLHGQTRDAAMSQLSRFLQQSAAAGRRCVLVITGKGTSGKGVLRREFPLWLEAGDLRPLVLGLAPAQAKDGGSGAFYVLLRRKR